MTALVTRRSLLRAGFLLAAGVGAEIAGGPTTQELCSQEAELRPGAIGEHDGRPGRDPGRLETDTSRHEVPPGERFEDGACAPAPSIERQRPFPAVVEGGPREPRIEDQADVVQHPERGSFAEADSEGVVARQGATGGVQLRAHRSEQSSDVGLGREAGGHGGRVSPAG